MECKDDEELNFEDTLGEQDKHTSRVGELAEALLNAMLGAIKRKSIMLVGNMKGLSVKILVDTSSLGSFVHYGLVNFLEVVMADGTNMTSGAIFPKVSWLIQDHHFQFDLKIMELRGWDIILGVDWKCHFSRITFDFHELSIALSHEGELLHLQGFINQLMMELVRGKDLTTFIQEKQ